MNAVINKRHCAFLFQVMTAIINGIFTGIFILEFAIGNLLHVFIAVVNCLDWVQRRKISPVDQIITALTVSRLAQLWLVETNILLFFIHSVNVTEIIVRMINITWVVTNHFNLWLSTKLSIFYLLKIVNFSNSIFLYLKWRVRQVVKVTLMLSLTLLFANVIVINIHVDIWIDVNRRNLPFNLSSSNSTSFLKNLLLTNSIFAVIPFAVSLLTFFLLIFSLWKHKKRMHHNARGSRDAGTRAHIKALQIGIAFLSLYAIFLLSVVINLCSIEVKENYPFFLLSLFIGIAFSSCHSCVLIMGNTKLRRASLSVLWCLRCRTKDAEFPSS